MASHGLSSICLRIRKEWTSAAVRVNFTVDRYKTKKYYKKIP
jgi:hypothetical protein